MYRGLEFAEREVKEEKTSNSDWHLEVLSEISFKKTSPQRLNHDQHLRLISQKNIPSLSSIIPATTLEKIFFYHTYTSSLSKTIMAIREQQEFNTFIWFYVFNVFCKSLPSVYVYMFLGSYVPNYHFFIPKIFPFMYGCNWLFTLTAVVELFLMTTYTLFCLDYLVCGLWYKVPWNRCSNENIYHTNRTFYNCCNLHQFKRKFFNTTIIKQKLTYVSSSNNEHFILAQFDYYFERFYFFWLSNKGLFITITFITIIWIYNVIQFNHLNKKYIWRLLGKAHIMYNVMLLFIFFHCLTNYTIPNIAKVKVSDERIRKKLIDFDFNMLAESMTAPPVAHVLSAKGTRYVRPNRDSAVIIISNAMNYFFKGLITILIRIFCENQLNAPLFFMENVDIDQVFNIWPAYFAMLEYGDIYVVFFFFLSFLTEFCTLIVSCQCLLESIVSEWNSIKPHYAASFIFMLSVTLKLLFQRGLLIIMFCYFKSLCTIVEAIVLYWMYPLGRLAEDIKFYCGYSLTKLRALSFQIVPLFYLFKMYTMLSCINMKENVKEIGITEATFFSLPLLPFVFGVLYAVYYYVIKMEKSWIQLFKPVPEWGPRDINMRNLRKQFDSRKYITSQAPRELSRHLIDKEQSQKYKLGIYYGSPDRGSPVSFKNLNVHFQNGKKFT